LDAYTSFINATSSSGSELVVGYKEQRFASVMEMHLSHENFRDNFQMLVIFKGRAEVAIGKYSKKIF
jgi:hypothetical protein